MPRSALLLVDFINEIVHENGKLVGKGYAEAVKRANVLARVNKATMMARSERIPVIFVCVGFSPDYGDWPATSPLFGKAREFGALKLGEWATELHESLEVDSGDFQVVKHRVSAFYGTSLDVILKSNQIETLLVGGVATDLAVQSTARDAHDRDYRVVVLEDLCAAGCQEDHDHAITSLAKIARISTSGQM
jgi:nicotinamidase-related amidase